MFVIKKFSVFSESAIRYHMIVNKFVLVVWNVAVPAYDCFVNLEPFNQDFDDGFLTKLHLYPGFSNIRDTCDVWVDSKLILRGFRSELLRSCVSRSGKKHRDPWPHQPSRVVDHQLQNRGLRPDSEYVGRGWDDDDRDVHFNRVQISASSTRTPSSPSTFHISDTRRFALTSPEELTSVSRGDSSIKWRQATRKRTPRQWTLIIGISQRSVPILVCMSLHHTIDVGLCFE